MTPIQHATQKILSLPDWWMQDAASKADVRERVAEILRQCVVEQAILGGLHDKTAEGLAKLFHETCARLAPEFGYRDALDKPWAEVPEQNKKLMIAVAAEILNAPPEKRAEHGPLKAFEDAVDIITRERAEKESRPPKIDLPPPPASTQTFHQQQ